MIQSFRETPKYHNDKIDNLQFIYKILVFAKNLEDIVISGEKITIGISNFKGEFEIYEGVLKGKDYDITVYAIDDDLDSDLRGYSINHKGKSINLADGSDFFEASPISLPCSILTHNLLTRGLIDKLARYVIEDADKIYDANLISECIDMNKGVKGIMMIQKDHYSMNGIKTSIVIAIDDYLLNSEDVDEFVF